MILTLQFTSSGVPQTGLSPSISGYRVDTNAFVFSGAMSHVAIGVYKYDFSGYDDAIDYSFIADGGATLSDIDRWQFGTNDIAQVTTQADSISAEHTTQNTDLNTQAVSISAAQTIQYTSLTNQADSISAAHASELAVIAGLVQRNQRIKNCSYGASGELVAATMSIYPSATDAQNETNVLKQFSLSAVYSAGNMIDYLVKEL